MDGPITRLSRSLSLLKCDMMIYGSVLKVLKLSPSRNI